MSSADLPAPLPPLVRQFIGDQRPVSRPAVGGVCSQVYLVGSRWAVKVARGRHPCRLLADERSALVALQRTPVRVPRVHAFATDRLDGEPRAFLVTDLIPGIPASRYLRECGPCERDLALRRIGKALRGIHEAACPSAWRGGVPWLATMLARAAQNLATGDVDGGDEADLADLSARRPPPVGPCLIHGDATLDNCLLDGDEVSFVDWGMAAFGDPRWDIVLLSCVDPTVIEVDGSGPLLHGYGAGQPDPALASYFRRLYEYF